MDSSTPAKSDEEVKTCVADLEPQSVFESTAKKRPRLGPGEGGENEEDDQSENEDDQKEAVMRTEIAVTIKDTAQPTVEEIKEFESFSSKYYHIALTLTTVFFHNVRAFSEAGNKG